MSRSIHYYSVGKKKFKNKIEAILESSITGEKIEWYFNDDIWSTRNWRIEPELSLSELYKNRAQQIRDEYDYVVISLSGGADSTNVFNSFVNNGIMPDEVVAGAPVSGLKNYSFNKEDTSHRNTMSETKYAQIPLIQEIAQKYPQIRTTINDYFEDMLEFKTDDWLLRCDDWIHPSGAARYRLENQKHLRDLADSGKKMAIVYGVDKPALMSNSPNAKDVCLALIGDLAVNVPRPPFDREYPNVVQELFYWGRDFPDIPIKQSHMLLRWLNLNTPESNYAKQWFFDFNKWNTRIKTHEERRIRQSKWERAIVPLIYPSLNNKVVFQAEKPINTWLGEHDQWFYDLHGETRIAQMVKSDVKNLFNSINGDFHGIRGVKHKSDSNFGFDQFVKWYSLGKINKSETNF